MRKANIIMRTQAGVLDAVPVDLDNEFQVKARFVKMIEEAVLEAGDQFVIEEAE